MLAVPVAGAGCWSAAVTVRASIPPKSLFTLLPIFYKFN